MKSAAANETLSALCRDNLDQLDQIDHLLAHIDSDDYTHQPVAADPIGKHVRHVLEHYESLLQSADGYIDYDNRARDSMVETDAQIASERIAALRARLAALPDAQVPSTVRVRYTSAGDDSIATDVESTLERECHFVLSHTVHHMALIALLAQRHGHDVPADFGVAGSTLRYRDTVAASAAVAQQ